MTLQEIAARVNWVDPELCSRFISDCEILWGTDKGRELVLEWSNMLGKPSQFLERHLWTVEDLTVHTEKLRLWEALNNDAEYEEASKFNSAEQTSVATVNPLREATDKWREAVAQRKANMAICKEWTDKEIEKLRNQYKETEALWDDYVAKARETMRGWKNVK